MTMTIRDFPFQLSEHAVLRPFTLEDAPALALYANNPAIAANLNDGFPSPYTLNDARDFILRRKEETVPQVLAIVIDGEAAGAIGIFPQQLVNRKNAELGYWIAEKYWGRGFATLAVKAIIPYAFANLDIIRLFARPFPFNPASVRVLEKAGFILEARIKSGLYKQGVIFDELIYSLLKHEDGEFSGKSSG